MSQDNRKRPTPKWATWGAVILLVLVMALTYMLIYTGPNALR